jgi:hypothetical protein
VHLVPKADTSALHAELSPLAFLVGRWAGEGEGEYPTIEPFRYGEEVTFSHVGKAFLAYAQRSWSLDDGRPLHAEMGYWRCPSPERVEVVVAHPTGHVELAEGSITGTSVALSSATVARTGSAKEVNSLVRNIDVAGAQLGYELRMAAVGKPLAVHLRGLLRRVAGP